MITIHLKDLAFHAHHGLYDDEKKLGNNFVVNLHVHYMPTVEMATKLEHVLNYEVLFAIVKRRMGQPTALLENIVMELCNIILMTFKQVMSVFISIEKLNPPIKGLVGSVAVSFQLNREQH